MTTANVPQILPTEDDDWVAIVYEEESYGIEVTEVEVTWPEMHNGAAPNREWAIRVLDSITNNRKPS